MKKKPYHFDFQFPILFLGETEIKQNLKDDLNTTLGFLEEFLSGNKWVAGDSVTIADTSIYSSLSSILVSGFFIVILKSYLPLLFLSHSHVHRLLVGTFQSSQT